MIFIFSSEPQTDLFGNPILVDDLEYDYDTESAMYTDIGQPGQGHKNIPTTSTTTATRRTTTRITTKTSTSPTSTTPVPTVPATSPMTGDTVEVELNVMTSIVRGRIEARLLWPTSGSEGGWTIRWGRETCHVTDAEDRCQLARETYAATIVGTPDMAEVGWLSGDDRVIRQYIEITNYVNHIKGVASWYCSVVKIHSITFD